MLERRKRGRPLGSGVKNYCAFGCRFTEEEYGSNNKIILNLFKRYGKTLEEKNDKNKIKL